MNENPVTGFFTWQVLGTQAGATAATLIIVRILDQVTPETWRRFPIILPAYVVALFLLIGADIALPPAPDVSSILLCFVNAFGVSVTAIGGDTLIRKNGYHSHEQPQSAPLQPQRSQWDAPQ